MFTVEEYYPEPGKLRYIVKRDGQLLFGLWPHELKDLKTALQGLMAVNLAGWREAVTDDQRRTSASS